MRTERGLPCGLALIALSGLAITSWTTMRPALAQDDPANPGRQPPGRRMMMGGPASVAASGDFVYVLRGNTLFQMRSSDLTLVKQADLPAPGPRPGGAENPNPNPANP